MYILWKKYWRRVEGEKEKSDGKRYKTNLQNVFAIDILP